MAEHPPATYELVEVKADDILGERQSFYGGFMTGMNWGVGAVIAILVLMALFLV